MKSLKLGLILSIIAILCFLFMGADKAISAEKTIRIGSPFKSGTIVVDAAEKFKELVEKGSGGRIEVKIDAGTKSEEVICKTNRTGEIEMQSNGTWFLQDYASPYYFFTNPYVMKDFDHYMRAWNGKLGQAARAQLEKNDLKYLATIYRGLRLLAEFTVPGAHVVIEVLHDVGISEEVVRGGVDFQEIRPISLHFEFAGPVHLIDFDFRFGSGVNLHLDPASAPLFDDIFEFLRRINHNRA